MLMGRTTAVSKQILNGEGGAAIVVRHFAQRNVFYNFVTIRMGKIESVFQFLN